MNDASRSHIKAPLRSYALLVLLYAPWVRYYFGSHPAPEDDADMMFPGALIFAFFGIVYLVMAIALAIRLYKRRRRSMAHRVAFYASLGILILLTTLIWRAD